AAAETARADEQVPRGAADAGADALQVRTPHALRLVVRMAHVIADRALLAADLTCARHRGPGGTTGWGGWQTAARRAARQAPSRMRRMSSLVETPGTRSMRSTRPPRSSTHS